MAKHFNNTVPFEELYQPALKEASRKKPVFFIHKYFARRITANFRTALLDYLYDDNGLIHGCTWSTGWKSHLYFNTASMHRHTFRCHWHYHGRLFACRHVTDYDQCYG